MVAAMFPDRDTDGDPPAQPARFLPGRLHVHHGPSSSSQDHGYVTPEVHILHGQTIQDKDEKQTEQFFMLRSNSVEDVKERRQAHYTKEQLRIADIHSKRKPPWKTWDLDI